ncbi:nucleotidyltransferase family protein [Erythrobacter dokdonensis]|uniref:nucleotidyltransferase family protein n=1 Tax=Erythrobacter dokdonensis TaxID=328225 RepID=UPI001302DB3F|nr:nucleotidyltransferase family protein [Erythrobacter dokdonensis]
MRATLRGSDCPPWSQELDGAQAEVISRIDFHGIALLLAGSMPDSLPRVLQESILEQARLQALWEISHGQRVAQLVEALHARGFEPLLMKGTAIAYSCYDDPAMRRRGDTDIVLAGAERDNARRCLRALGFRPRGHHFGLQEAWVVDAQGGFTHEVDVHWAMSSSTTLAAALAQNGFETRTIALPRLSANARSLGLVDNILMICINRQAHNMLGYHIEGERVFDSERLIWAVDLDLMCARLDASDWSLLSDISHRSGAAGTVLAGLLFARDRLGTGIPDRCIDSLSAETAEGPVSRYLAQQSNFQRFRQDFAAAPDWGIRRGLVLRQVFPERDVLEDRFPDKRHWPNVALYTWRLLQSASALLRFGRNG